MRERAKTCCLNCEKRYVGCHSECDDYKEFCRLNEEERQKIQAGRNKTSAHDSYIRDNRLKIEKRERGSRVK